MSDEYRLSTDVEVEVATHLGMRPDGIRLYVSEKQNRSEIRPHTVHYSYAVPDMVFFEVLVPPDWLERKYKTGIWRGFNVYRLPYLVVQFGWGNERSNGRQGLANVKALSYVNVRYRVTNEHEHSMQLAGWRFGLHCMGATYLSDYSFEDCWAGAESHAAEKLGVNLPCNDYQV